MDEVAEQTTTQRQWRPGDYLTTEEAAAFTGFSVSFLHKHRALPPGPESGPRCTMRAPNKAFYRRSDLDRWLQEREKLFSPSFGPARRPRRRSGVRR